MSQHNGDFVVSNIAVISNRIAGVTHVRRGGKLVASGELLGGLVVDAGGKAVVSGRVGRNVLNDGNLVLSGQVAGKILGKGAVVMGSGADVAGNDLPIEPMSESGAV